MKKGPGKANPYNEFLESCKTGNLEGVSQGISHLKDDIITKNGNQALQIACKFGQFNVVVSLLKVPSIRKLVSADDNCAIRVAAENKYSRIVELLIDIAVNARPIIKKDYPEIYKYIQNREKRLSVAQFARALRQWKPVIDKQVLPQDLRFKILTFAYHPKICGKQECSVLVRDSLGSMSGQRFCQKIVDLKKYEQGEPSVDEVAGRLGQLNLE